MCSRVRARACGVQRRGARPSSARGRADEDERRAPSGSASGSGEGWGGDDRLARAAQHCARTCWCWGWGATARRALSEWCEQWAKCLAEARAFARFRHRVAEQVQHLQRDAEQLKIHRQPAQLVVVEIESLKCLYTIGLTSKEFKKLRKI